MIKFTIVKGELQVKWQDLTIPVFEEIYQLDTSENKAWALAMLKYIFYMADETDENSYKDLPFYTKEKNARTAAFRQYRDFTERETYYANTGIAAYIEHNSTVDKRTIQTYNDTIEKMRVLIENNPPEMIRYQEPSGVNDEQGRPIMGKVSWVTNTKIINDALKDINLVTEARDKVEQRLNKGVQNAKNKGGYVKSASEKGLIAAPGAAEKLKTGGN